MQRHLTAQQRSNHSPHLTSPHIDSPHPLPLFFIQKQQSGNAQVAQLKQLQQSLRSGTGLLDPVQAISPFVSLLRSPQLAGPFKLVAMHALQTFIDYNTLLEVKGRTPDALLEIIEAVTGCRFVQTDTAGDDLVHLQIVQTLHCIIKSSCSAYLTDEAMWQVVEFCFATLTNVANSNKGALCHAAETTILDVVRFVFGCQLAAAQSQPQPRPLVGMPCALKVLGYFMGIVQRHSSETGKSAGGAGGLGGGGGNSSAT